MRSGESLGRMGFFEVFFYGFLSSLMHCFFNLNLDFSKKMYKKITRLRELPCVECKTLGKFL